MPYCGLDGVKIVEQSTDPWIGQVLDRYRILGRLGDGAMGVVYRASHTVIRREYAIKVLFGGVAANERFVRRLRREAETTSQLRHPNIVTVEDFGRTELGVHFLVMELVEGRTLASAIAAEPRFSLARTASIIRQVAAGLSEAHGHGFIHRDVKPSNVMLTQLEGREHVKVLDFGVVAVIGEDERASRLTTEGAMIGTPMYMAPESCEGGVATAASDLYSLGVILYELLAGRPPFSGPPVEVFAKHLVEAPARLPPSKGLEQLAHHLLEKRPEARPESAHRVIHAIDQLGFAPQHIALVGGMTSARVTAADTLDERTIDDSYTPTEDMQLDLKQMIAASKETVDATPPEAPAPAAPRPGGLSPAGIEEASRDAVLSALGKKPERKADTSYAMAQRPARPRIEAPRGRPGTAPVAKSKPPKIAQFSKDSRGDVQLEFVPLSLPAPSAGAEPAEEGPVRSERRSRRRKQDPAAAELAEPEGTDRSFRLGWRTLLLGLVALSLAIAVLGRIVSGASDPPRGVDEHPGGFVARPVPPAAARPPGAAPSSPPHRPEPTLDLPPLPALEEALEAALEARGLTFDDLQASTTTATLTEAWKRAREVPGNEEAQRAAARLVDEVKHLEIGEPLLHSRLVRLGRRISVLGARGTPPAHFGKLRARHAQLEADLKPGLTPEAYVQLQKQIAVLEHEVIQASR